MKTSRRCAGACVVAVALGLAATARAGVVDEARSLLEAGKYDEVDKVLEKLLAGRGAPNAETQEALQVSLDAALQGGRVMTAQRRVSSLLSVKQTPELLFLGGEIARRAGEPNLALTRFLAFSRKQDRKSDELRVALVYLMRNGRHPDEYHKYVTLFGLDGGAWRHGLALYERLLRDGQVAKGLQVARAMISRLQDPARIAHMHSLFRSAVDGQLIFTSDGDSCIDLLDTMLEGKALDTENLRYVFARCCGSIPAQRRVEIAFAIQEQSERPFSWDHTGHFMAMKQIASEDAKLDAGRKFLSLERKFTSSDDRYHHEQFLAVIEECPEVFNIAGKELVSVTDVQDKFAALEAKFRDRPSVLQTHMWRLAERYLNRDQGTRAAFLDAYIRVIDADRFRDLVNLTQGKELERQLREATEGRSYTVAMDINSKAMEWFERNKNERALMDAALEYMSAYPGRFSWQYVYDRIIRNAQPSVDGKVALLEELVRKGGRSGPMVEMFRRINDDKGDAQASALRESASFQALARQLESDKPGTDLLMRTHVTLCNIPQNRGSPDAAIALAVKGMLAGYSKKVPGSFDLTKNREDHLARDIVRMHWEHVWDNRNAIHECVRMWAPRLGLGDAWQTLTRRAREHHGGGEVLYEVAPYYLALTSGQDKGMPEVWWELKEAINPDGKRESVFAGHYDEMGAWNAIYYIRRQERVFGEQGVLDKMSEVMSQRDFKFDSIGQVADIAYHVYSRSERGGKAPSSLATKMWEFLEAEGKRTGVYSPDTEARIYGQYARTARGEEASRQADRHIAAAAKRNPVQKAEAISALCDYLPQEDGKALKRGFRFHTELEVLKPICMAAPPSERAAYYASGRVVEDMLFVLRDFPEQDKSRAAEFLSTLVDMLVDGAYYNGRGDLLMSMLNVELNISIDRLTKGAATPDAWDRISRIARLYAYAMPHERDSNRLFDSHISPTVSKLLDAKAQEAAYVFVVEIERAYELDEGSAKKLALLKSKLAQGIPDMLAVDSSDPTYDLHVAAQALSQGNEPRAWELTSGKLALLPKTWVSLDADYVAWSIEQMRKQKMLNQGLELAFMMLVREFDLTASVASRVSLAKGDIYRDMQNYQAARIEYEGLNNNRRYNGTEYGSKAKYRLIDLLILTKDYSAAEGILERLVDSNDVRAQAEAYFLYAKMAFDQTDYKEAKDYLTEVFKRVNDHMESRLLEGELKLLLPRGLASTEVLVGNPKLRTIAIPGRPLILKLHDTNLSIARGGSAIPVIVTTSKGRDEESVKLFPSSGEKFLFTGTIVTALGEAKKNNLQLELIGDDTVSYVIDPKFQKANEIEYPPKYLAVKSDARLVASAGEILSEEEAEKRELQRRLANAQELESRRFQGRTGSTVRPGSFIYVQVADSDRDVSNGVDKVGVDLKTSSGDLLKAFPLEETGEHTGIFRGKIATGIPYPKALASDAEEGKDPGVLISSRKDGVWTSLADAQKPKWVEVDTMSSHAVSEVTLDMEAPDRVSQIALMGTLEDDYEMIAALPAWAGGGMGLMGEYYQGRSFNKRKYTRVDPVIDFTQGKMRSVHNKMHPENLSVRWTGTVESRFSEEYTFYTMSDDGVRLWIDGKKILDNWTDHGGTENRGTARLEAGRRHRIKLEFYQGGGGWVIQLSWSSERQTKQIVPAAALRPPGGEGKEREPLGKIAITADGFRATLTNPLRVRKLRWLFEDYEGNSVSARKINVKDGAGATVIPVDLDFAEGLSNSRLEIAPGDRIEVSYNDEKRTAVEKPVLRAKLNSSYFNGTVMVANEVIRSRGEERWIDYQQSIRCRVGDQLTIVVEDYDEDLSDRRDTVPVTVTTSGGEKLTLKALETRVNGTEEQHARSGVFVAILKIGETTGRDQIALRPGETLTASFLDKENTRPGVPVERDYPVVEAGRGQPELGVYRTSVELVEDDSPQAQSKIKRMKLRGSQVKDMVIHKEIVVAKHPEDDEVKGATADAGYSSASANAPLLFELSLPSMALNSGSVFKILAVAESELTAAKKEGRKPSVLEVPTYVKSASTVAGDFGYQVRIISNMHMSNEAMLEEGRFAGIVRLQLGSPGDPVDDLVISSRNEFARPAERAEGDYGNRIPTLIVAGSDVVHLTVKTGANGDSVTKKVKLMSSARLELLDETYSAEREAIHLGAKFSVKLTDYDRDVGPERDKVRLAITSKSGDSYTLELTETLPHSGVFTGSVKPEFLGDIVGGRPDPQDKALSVAFGDEVTFKYVDQTSMASDAPVDVVKVAKIHHGFDGELAAFTKRFKDSEMAVKTRFLMAEALFEMAKEHRKISQPEKAADEIATGKRILEEAIRDYPNTSLVAQGDFLLANLAQELEKYQEAIGRYSNIISNWPDSEFAPRSQFKKAICLEKLKNYDQACEEYVRLTYVYPDSSLVADATVRMGNYYFKRKAYKVASRIFLRFQQKHPAHPLSAKALFLSALSNMKMEAYKDAIKKYVTLIEEYPDDKTVRSEAMYWLGDAYFRDNQYDKAYQGFKKLTWDYPESKWAKIARGRLTEDALANFEDQ